MVKCNTCGGIYARIQADGTRYFHRCPPRSRVELAQLIADGTLGFPPGTSAATFAAAATPADSPIAGSLLAAADAWLNLRPFERAHLRDENIVRVDRDGTETIVAEGLGVSPVADPAIGPATV